MAFLTRVSVGLFLFFASFQAKAITADELALHLGIQSWETQVLVSQGSTVTVIQVIGGKEGESLGVTLGTNRPKTLENRITLIVSHNQGRLDGTFSLSAPSGEMVEAVKIDWKDTPVGEIRSLPSVIGPGDYILMAIFGEKKDPKNPSISEIEQGIILRVKEPSPKP